MDRLVFVEHDIPRSRFPLTHTVVPRVDPQPRPRSSLFCLRGLLAASIPRESAPPLAACCHPPWTSIASTTRRRTRLLPVPCSLRARASTRTSDRATGCGPQLRPPMLTRTPWSLYVPEAQGSLLPGLSAQCVRRTRTCLGRAVRTACRVVHRRPVRRRTSRWVTRRASCCGRGRTRARRRCARRGATRTPARRRRRCSPPAPPSSAMTPRQCVTRCLGHS